MTLDPRYLTFGLVGFVDLLGFSDRVKAIKTNDDLEAVEKDVRLVHRWFDYRSTDDSIKQVQQFAKKKVFAFSDCLVISVSSLSKLAKSQGTFDFIMNEIWLFGLAQTNCVNNRIFIRGGAGHGIWYKRGDAMISPAGVRAVELEKEANVPMIAIDPELHKFLAEHKHRGNYSSDFDPLPKVVRWYDNLPNGKAHWFIDYFRIWLDAIDGTIAKEDQEKYKAADADTKQEMRNHAYAVACAETAAAHRDIVRDAYLATDSAKVREKYKWLAWYHDDVLMRFYGEPPLHLLLGDPEKLVA